jgi:hypothetical protein
MASKGVFCGVVLWAGVTCAEDVCTGASAKLSSMDCRSWLDFFDAAGGSKWSACSDARTDPCGCTDGVPGNVTCGCYQRPLSPPCSPTIQSVRLSGIGLSGDVAAAWAPLSKMYGLRELDVSGNQLTGSLPEDPMLNTDVGFLDVSANALTGSIPVKLGDLTDVSYLNMSHNALSGALPAKVGDMTNMLHLDLSSNRLTGPIPQKVQCGMTDIQSIDLSSNAFTGPIPVFVCGVRHDMETMHLEHNRFNGSVPSQLAEMNALAAVYAQGNLLSGAVPASLGSLGLSALRLDGNALSGSLPPLPFSKYTGYCALNANQFECPLPGGARECKQGPPTCK